MAKNLIQLLAARSKSYRMFIVNGEELMPVAPDEPFELKANTAKLYADLLESILRQLITESSFSKLTELQSTHNKLWAAVDSEDQAKADLLRQQEKDLAQEIVDAEIKRFSDSSSDRLGKFEIFVGADEQFYFRLKAENGLIIAASQGYTTKQSAQNGIEAIQRVGAQAEVVDMSLAAPDA